MEAPIETEFKVWCTDGEQYGQVTVSAALGRYPTVADVDKAIAQAKEAIAELDGFRVCASPREFREGIAAQKFGHRMSVVGAKEWEAPYSPRAPEYEKIPNTGASE